MNKEIPAFLLAGGRQSGSEDMLRLMTLALAQAAPLGTQGHPQETKASARDRSKPQIAYIGAANGDSLVFFTWMKALLLKAGAGKIRFIRLAKEKIDLRKTKESLSSSEVIFLAGGEVEDGVRWLEKHGLTGYLKELHSAGKLFVGVSAGTIMMGAYWARGENLDDPASSELFTCLGVIPVVFDVHAEGEDWTELKTVLTLMGDGAIGYGVPRGGMISADSGGRLTNIEQAYLTFVNDAGRIVLLP